ncbi:hypothetical protein [Hymenobacter cellulosivorans]|uniref:Uncharacterized protein n=1 Tax=Hymenobacter cellulosivorans TaxID=2932249 RepID=A0ABY4FCZ6_9BACT|nr:hypothetical protein [Hymenobacter cellulosivorans]UOQ54424.1 hypothetical protein MUN80_06600 [Hymenobacter cellulosivorans]
MTFPRRLVSLLSALLLTATSVSAQTPLGQPTLDEQKVQIWCATVRYVYDDNNRPNLKSSLNCGGSLPEFVTSIKADSQKVYSMLYQPLEGKGTMYKGLGSDKSRLQKLTTEIINKLQASPARKADAARMAKLNTLKEQLDTYLANGTPPADLNSDVTAGGADTEDTSVADEATLAAADAGAGQGTVEANTMAPRPAAASESLMNKLFAPLALILSLLSIFLYVMLRRSISALGTRADRHRSELESVKAAAMSGSAPSAGVIAAAGVPKRMTPELQREIERIVQQRVAEELAKQQPTAQPAKVEKPAPQPAAQPRPATGPARPVTAAPAQAPAPARPVASAPAPVASAPPAPAQNQFQNIESAPTTYAPPMPMQETAHTPQPIPSGSPASAPRDEFDSLVPPVQLPGPETWETPAPVAAAPITPAPTRYYVKVPVNGGFSDYDLQDQPQHDSIYEITPDPKVPERATFRVTSNTSVHAYAIQSAQYSLREACAYQQPNGPVSRIVTDKAGTLIKGNGAWQIELKAAIHFE